MKEKLFEVGKSTLATVMAASMSLCVCSTLPVVAEEVLQPIDETTELVEDQGNTIDVVEDETEKESDVSKQEVTEEPQVYHAPEMKQASSLPQSSSYPSGYSEANTVDDLKVELQGLIAEADNIWTTKGGYDYFKNNVSINQAIDKTIPKAKEYLAEGNSDSKTFSWRCYEMKNVIKAFNNQSNIINETTKEVYELVKQRDGLNRNAYTLDTWDTYNDSVDKALTMANGTYPEDSIKQQIDVVKQAFKNLKPVDSNLEDLKTVMSEVEAIIAKQQNLETAKKYTRDSWTALTDAYVAAQSVIHQNLQTITEQEANTLKTNLLNAKDGLKIDEANTPGSENGVLDEWKNYSKNSNIRGGKLYVSNEVLNDDDTATLTVKWVNDGTDPFTGGLFTNTGETINDALNVLGKYSLRPIKSGDIWKNKLLFTLTYTKDGQTNYLKIDKLTDDQSLNGFEQEFNVPAGSVVKLKITQWNGRIAVYSLGNYYVGQLEENEAPVIMAENVELTVGDVFDPLKDVKATDKEDGDITKDIQVVFNDVDTTKPGSYTVTYEVSDSNQETVTKEIVVIVKEKPVVDNDPPVITAENVELTVGDAFDPLKGVKATDKEDGDITKDIQVVFNDVDTTKLGKYTVTYEVSDSMRVTTTKQITVTVKEKKVDKDKTNTKEDKKSTGPSTGVGKVRLYMGLAASSIAGIGILEVLKKRKK